MQSTVLHCAEDELSSKKTASVMTSCRHCHPKRKTSAALHQPVLARSPTTCA